MSNFQDKFRSVISQLQSLMDIYGSNDPHVPNTPPDSPLASRTSLNAVTAELEEARQIFRTQLDEVRANLITAEANVRELRTKCQEYKDKYEAERALRMAASETEDKARIATLKQSVANLKALVRECHKEIDDGEAEILELRRRESEVVRRAEESLQAKLEQALDLLEGIAEEKQAMLAAHRQEVERLGNQATSQVEEARGKNKATQAELQQSRAEAEKRDKEAQVKIKSLDDQLSKALKDNATIRSKDAEQQRMLKTKQSDAESDRRKFDQTLTSMKVKHDQEVNEMKVEHDKKLSSMQDQIEATVADLETKHNQAIRSMELEQGRTVAMLETEHNQTISDLQAEHRRAIDNLDTNHNRQIADLESRLEKFSIAAGKGWQFRKTKDCNETPVSIWISLARSQLRLR